MENRRYERIDDSLEAEIVSGGTSYPGVIMNFSAEGLYMVTATARRVVEITPSTVLTLKCTLPSGERVSMDCRVIWFQTKLADHGVAFSMGMEIEDPPPAYREFVASMPAHQTE